MIIGFDGSRAFVDKATGTENYSYQLLKNLSKIDLKNTYKVFLRPNTCQDEYWPSNFNFLKINWSRLWTQGGLALKTFFENLDVLFVPAHTLPLFFKKGLKTVITVHDLGSEYLPKTHQLKQRLYLGLMQRYQLQKATRLIAVSNSTKQDLINRLKIAEDKITVVYEGYDNQLFKPQKTDDLKDILKRYDIDPFGYFLFVGTVQPRKNLARIITAFSKLSSNKNLVIVGKKGWLSDEIYLLPKKLGVQLRVKFIDYVPNEHLPAIYSGSIALVFCSLFEGFGLPIIEAQACGCPVITSNISSMPEVAGKGAILVDPYSIDDIVDGMERVKRKRERGKLVEAGFENVKRFSWEKCAKETLKVLEMLRI